MGDGGRIIKGAIQAVAWTNGAERLTVHVDGVTHHMTRYEYEVYLNGRRVGAEEMRERAARRAGSLFAMPEEMRDELSASAPDHEDLIAANCGVVIENAIRALPLEG